MKPYALVTNDDGIESAFMHRLVEALVPNFEVAVAAPAFEQSWIGRAISRRREVDVIHSPSLFPNSVQAWAVSGTPTDCVNIALGNLLERKPDIVISGINIGFNTTETLVLCSGTVAGAIEGANWGIPAVAFSKCVPEHLFERIRDANGRTEGDFDSSLACACEHARRLSLELLAQPAADGNVVNINFPPLTQSDSPVETTFPAKLYLGSFYQEVSPGKYRFRYSDGIVQDTHPKSDRAALDRGSISRSVLDFSRIGARDELTAQA
ncbi:5'/3'-nucleotidase SurE [Coraliomargarita akajimensis]|uniref:5'-nucleotidase n=1 Tax=Coraliomargarita akajimensis (strain DSM 45221 / IAM 15411 / JCM 23193 / KCTC 12865 / 04OKA010-24) TaxID=583355 RepID=D5ENE9_CORAD|nr:5'/3'-nucleotidase SurE [Coraliomargarita akajimensis]ADE55425.1 stationary-phase survival protein SurE [Coraliomargarita akajimensis DSM 45221]